MTEFMWLDPITPLSQGEFQFYPIPGLGKLPRVTSIIDTYGFGHHALSNWKVNTQQEATIEAAWQAAISRVWYPDAFSDFKFRVESILGSEKIADKKRDEAAEIGSAAHRHIRWWLDGALGVEPILERGESRLASLSFQSWFAESGLRPLRTEQLVYSKKMRCAGSIDVVAEDPDLGPGVLDIKTSKYIYEKHHYQGAAYLSCGRELGADLRWMKFIRVPKFLNDPAIANKTGIEIVELGDIYGRPTPMTVDETQVVFAYLCACWHVRFSHLREGD